MFQGLSNIASLMSQAKQMGSRLQEINEQLKTRRLSAATGAGLVEVEVNGLGELLAVRIDPSLVEQGDLEMIQDLIPAAVNEAVAKANQARAEAMSSLTEGINLPGMEAAMANLFGGASQ